MERSEIPFLTVAELGERIRNRDISPVDVTEAYLERIGTLNTQIRAYLTVTADIARQAARDCEAEIAAGNYRGPLHGIPVAVKDQMYTEGVRTTIGTPLFDEFVPEYDATVITRLKQAGAVLLGKLNMTEFATTALSHQFDPPRNPWDRERSCGGSSSGSGGATAAFMAAATLGEDTGGSVRCPAAWCGLAGLRPTWGLVSRYGVMPGVRSMDTVGPLARTVEDCAIMLQAIAGHDPNDRLTSQETPPDYRAALTGDINGLRIGILKEVLASPHIDADTRAAFDSAAGVLSEMGAVVEELSIPIAAHSGPINSGIRVEAPTTYRNLLWERPQDIGHDNRIGYLTQRRDACPLLLQGHPLAHPPEAGRSAGYGKGGPVPDSDHWGASAAIGTGPSDHRQGQRGSYPLAVHQCPQPGQPARTFGPMRLQRRRPASEPADRGAPLRGDDGSAGRSRLRAGHRLAYEAPRTVDLGDSCLNLRGGSGYISFALSLRERVRGEDVVRLTSVTSWFDPSTGSGLTMNGLAVCWYTHRPWPGSPPGLTPVAARE